MPYCKRLIITISKGYASEAETREVISRSHFMVIICLMRTVSQITHLLQPQLASVCRYSPSVTILVLGSPHEYKDWKLEGNDDVVLDTSKS